MTPLIAIFPRAAWLSSSKKLVSYLGRRLRIALLGRWYACFKSLHTISLNVYNPAASY